MNCNESEFHEYEPMCYRNSSRDSTDEDCERALTPSDNNAIDLGTLAMRHPSEPSRNILVGYAFGPKKMSTMQIVMAEASKALSIVMSDVYVLDSEDRWETMNERSQAVIGLKRSEIKGGSSGITLEGEESSLPSLISLSTKSSCGRSRISTPQKLTSSLGRWLYESSNSLYSSSLSLGSASHCHSILKSSSTASQSSSIFSGFPATPLNNMTYKKISFVPLDLDSPLEEQHGGHFDVILHKLTEDILCISNKSVSNHDPNTHTKSVNNIMYTHAMKRVQTLNRYKRDHPSCCLVDHPDNIQALMSRSDIARILTKCLVSVTTASGWHVSSPRHFIIRPHHPLAASIALNHIRESNFTYPLIAKPLTAAGTVKSHRMVVVLNAKGLERIPTPCLVQEYANHDGMLYKVYVMGEKVWVFPRNSLPNLPVADGSKDCCDEEFFNKDYSFVEFDSQKPYPKLSDFGIELRSPAFSQDKIAKVFSPIASIDMVVNENGRNTCTPPTIASKSTNSAKRANHTNSDLDHTNYRSCPSTPSTSVQANDIKRQKLQQVPAEFSSFPTGGEKTIPSPIRPQDHVEQKHPMHVSISAEEIRPVATALGEAFGLSLFGFDILIAQSWNIETGACEKKILVVDVNYFPSYKEVPNFPAKLAQYLSHRAIKGRREANAGRTS